VTATHPARRLWQVLETIHAVVYFDETCLTAAADAGLKGFWMGYFAFRAAPMGAVGPDVVEAVFAGFHPDRVARALPDAWSYASPETCLDARREAAGTALRSAGVDAGALADAAAVLEPALPRLVAAGRPLGAANRALPLPDDPVERLWQVATTLREHRGDGHIAALVAAGITGLESNVLRAERDDAPIDHIQASRGWSADDWSAAADALRARGTTAAVLDDVEARTDHAAWAGGLDVIGEEGADRVVALLTTSARAAGSRLRYPNPIGLPPVAG